MVAILVNFAEDGKFGCDQKCPFCEWSKLNYSTYYYPEDEELDALHQVSIGEIWQISGGGDPLYHFEQNKNKLEHLATYAHKLGHRVQLLTRKTDEVVKYFDELTKYIDYWYISVPDCPTSSFIELSKKLNGKLKVNVVLNYKSDDQIDWDRVKKIITNYEPYVKRIVFRENFLHPFIENNQYVSYDKKEASIRINKQFKLISPNAVYASKGQIKILFDKKIQNGAEINTNYLGASYDLFNSN